MEIQRSIDIEDEIRQVLAKHLTAYCRPLPKDFSTPCILVSQVTERLESGDLRRGTGATCN
jgi:hypothetical protein